MFKNTLIQCFICNEKINFEKIQHHFFSVHNFEFEKNNNYSQYICIENKCYVSFNSFQNYRRHIINLHLRISPVLESRIQEINVNSLSIGESETSHLDLICQKHQNVAQNEEFEEQMYKLIEKIKRDTNFTNTNFKIILELLKHSIQIFSDMCSLENDLSMVTKNFFKIINSFSSNSNFEYIQSTEIILGYRKEMRQTKSGFILKDIPETLQYISVIETLKQIVKNPNMRYHILHESPSSHGYSSYIDGSEFKNNVFLQKYPNSLRLSLYYDDVEVTNPIGSKRGFHKVGLFYITIQNLPNSINSSLEGIFILSVAYTLDIKKYGFKKILCPFFNDLKLLETDDGVEVVIENNKTFILRSVLANFTGDTLAAHDIFEFLGPSSNAFCRTCLIVREDFKLNYNSTAQLRTKELHNAQLGDIIQNPSKAKEFGFKTDSILNASKYFHITNNFVFDTMHDIFEGVAQFDLKWILHDFICNKKYFTVSYLNSRINFFKYGAPEQKNKPSPNFTIEILNNNSSKITQKAIQTWLLLRSLPFLIGSKVPEHDIENFDVMYSLLKIIEIVFF